MTNIPDDLQQRIAEYIEGELAPADAARLEVFLTNSDPALAREVMGMITDRQAVRMLGRVAAPRDLSARIMEQIERASLLRDVDDLSEPRRRWWQSRGMIAASVALLLGGFSYLVVTSVISPGGHKSMPLAAGTPGMDKRSADAKEEKAATESLAKNDGETRLRVKEGETVALDAGKNKDVTTTAPEDHSLAQAREMPAETQIAGAMGGPSPMDQVDAMARAGQAGGRGGFGSGAGPIGGAAPGGAPGAAGGGGGGGAGAGGPMPSAARGGGGGAGGRRGAAPAIAMANPSPATINNPNISDSAAKALATLAQTPSRQPIVMTFYARDAQDVTKIANSLDAYNTANRGNIGSLGQGTITNFNLSANTVGTNVTNNNGGNWNGRAQNNNEIQQQTFANGTNQFAGNTSNTALSAAGPFRLVLKSDQLNELAGQYRVALVARGDEVHLFNQLGNAEPATADKKQRSDLLTRAGFAGGNENLPATRAAIAMAATTSPAVAPQAPTAAPPATAAPATAPDLYAAKGPEETTGQSKISDAAGNQEIKPQAPAMPGDPIIQPQRSIGQSGLAINDRDQTAGGAAATPVWFDCVITIETPPAAAPAASRP